MTYNCAIMTEIQPSFQLILTGKCGHTITLSPEESRDAIEYYTKGQAYMTYERAEICWTCTACPKMEFSEYPSHTEAYNEIKL